PARAAMSGASAARPAGARARIRPDGRTPPEAPCSCGSPGGRGVRPLQGVAVVAPHLVDLGDQVGQLETDGVPAQARLIPQVGQGELGELVPDVRLDELHLIDELAQDVALILEVVHIGLRIAEVIDIVLMNPPAYHRLVVWPNTTGD